jgi:hypothetical protein
MVRRSFLIFGVSLATRLAAIAYLVPTTPNSLSWGSNEAGGIARWIVLNHSYSSPFHGATGPTAWLAPVYPALIAVLFKIFGVQTSAAFLAALILNAVFAAITGVMVYQIARDLWSPGAGLFAGILWALCPYFVMLALIPWETCLAALAFTIAFKYTLRMKKNDGGEWARCGLIWGFVALINPALVTPLPLLLGYRTLRDKQWRSAFILCACALAVVSPWMVRDYIAFHHFIPIRSNGIAEMYFASVGYSEHPLADSMEYQSLGEEKFTSGIQTKMISYVSSHPAAVVQSFLKRAAGFWSYPVRFWPIVIVVHAAALVGLILLFVRKKKAWLFAAVLAVFPLAYYASLPYSRYRHPIEPLLCVLAGCALGAIRREQAHPQLELSN